VTIEPPHLCGTTRPALRLQVADAYVIVLAERLDLRDVATLDRRDFQVIAPRHLPKGQQLTKLPGWTMALRYTAVLAYAEVMYALAGSRQVNSYRP
jgi:hypothetical protein